MSRSKQWILLDNFKRKLFIKQELKKILLKSLLKNAQLPLIYRYYAFFIKVKATRWTSISQQKNRCVKTGRSWGILKFTKYSRFVLRTETYRGNLPGFRKSSW